MIEKFPQIKIPNKFFRNTGQLTFADLKDSVDEQETYSNGAVYADFDNDGDLDIVTNNIDEPALLYQNKTNDYLVANSVKKQNDDTAKTNENASREKTPKVSDSLRNHYLQIRLTGDSAKNLRAVGSKLIVYAGKETILYEKFPVHGFQSSIEAPFHAGLGGTKVDSIILIWPDNTYQTIPAGKTDTILNLRYKTGLPLFNYKKAFHSRSLSSDPVSDITAETGLRYTHQENGFPEFNREPLMPHMLSTEGPASGCRRYERR